MSIVKAKYVLLPTNKSITLLGKHDCMLVFNDFTNENFKGEPQEVYVTIDESVLVGQWGMGWQVGIRGKGAGNYLFFNDGSNGGKLDAICKGARRIVTTTDKNLSGVSEPNIEFLQSLVFNFNNENKCDDVTIDFDDVIYYNGIKIFTMFNEITNSKDTFTAYDIIGSLICKNKPIKHAYKLPKVNSDNMSIIEFFKNNYTRDEAISLCEEAFRSGQEFESSRFNEVCLSKWIENNFQ